MPKMGAGVLPPYALRDAAHGSTNGIKMAARRVVLDTNVLVAAAHSLHEIARAKVHCIRVGEPQLDWAALIDREKQLIRPIPQSIARTLAERGVEIIWGMPPSVPTKCASGGRRSRPSIS